MKKTIFTGLSLIILLAVISGCGGNGGGNGSGAAATPSAETPAGTSDAAGQSEQQDEAKEPITLRLAVWDDKLKETIEQVADIYKQTHSHVTVELTVTPVKDYWTKTQTSIAGGGGPDIFMINGPNFHRFASLGLLTSLNPLIEGDGLDTSVYPQGINDLYTYDGVRYGIPYYLGSIGLFYNKELFDKAGLAYPDESWTWETLKENAAKLTDKSNNQYGYIAVNEDQVGFYPLIHQGGGSVLNEDGKTSGLNSPGTIKAISFMKELIDAGISPTAQQQLETPAVQIFGSGQAALYPGGSFDALNLSKQLGDKLGVTALPYDEKKGFYVHGSSWVISNATKHQQEAWELLKLITGKEGAELLAANGINFPAYTEYVELWAQSIPDLDMTPFVQSLDDAVAYPVSLNTSEWSTILKEQITLALIGEESVEDALAKAAEGTNKVLASE